MGGGGGAKAKIKIEQGKQTKKKFVHQKCLKKKIRAETFQYRENYKLVCILYIYNYKVQCKGVPQS